MTANLVVRILKKFATIFTLAYRDSSLSKPLLFFSISFFSISTFALNGRTTYQAKIIKPDGYPLEATSVLFNFSVLDSSGACTIYNETHGPANMQGSGGLISFALGGGTPSPSNTVSFKQAFSNASGTVFTCNNGTSSPVITPTSDRKIVMQFNDGLGWQTLPAMSINAVPYAMYATDADNSNKLNGKSDTAFIEKASIPTCPSDEMLYFNSVSFGCVPYNTGSGSGGITSVSTAGGSPLSNIGTASAPVISITAASVSSDGYITSVDYAEFKSKLNAASATSMINSSLSSALASQTLAGDVSGDFSNTQVDSIGGKTAAQVSTSVDDTVAATSSETANTIVKRDSSGNVRFNNVSTASASLSYVDIFRPSTNFNVRLQASTSLSSNYVLTLPATSGTVGQVLSTDGAGQLSWIDASPGSVTAVNGTASEITSTGGATPSLGLANVGTAGTYFKITTDAKGRVTSGVTTITLSDLPNTLLTTASNFSGDVSGLISNITVNRIQGVSVTTTSLNTNDILQYNGSSYINRNIPTCSGSQYLTFNGTSFTCANDAGASGSVSSINVTGPLTSTASTGALTLSITQVSSMTSGFLSSSDYINFNNKITSSAASIEQVLGYVPANITTVSSTLNVLSSAVAASFTSVTSNILSVSGSVSLLSNSIKSIRSSQWSDVTSGSLLTTNVTSSVFSPLGQLGTRNTSPTGGSNDDGWFTLSLPFDVSYNGVSYSTIHVSTNSYVTFGSGSSQYTSLSSASPALNKIMIDAADRSSNSVWFVSDSFSFSIRYEGGCGTSPSNALVWELQGSSASPTQLKLQVISLCNGGFSTVASPTNQLSSLTPVAGTAYLIDYFALSNSIIYSGNVGIGTSLPYTKLEVSGGLKVGMETSSCSINLAGTLRYNANKIEFCNGTIWAAFGVSTSGLTSLNGSTSQTQTFAIGVAGNAPAFITANGVHTLNIPLASVGTSTAGLISNADYVNFNNKITSSAASVAQVLGYVPVSSTALSNYVLRSNNLSDLSSTATARTNLGLGGFAVISSLDLGSASATGTLANARLPAFTGDVTSVAGTNSLSVVQLQGVPVSSTAPTSGQVLMYNGANWAPATSNNSVSTGEGKVFAVGGNPTFCVQTRSIDSSGLVDTTPVNINNGATCDTGKMCVNGSCVDAVASGVDCVNGSPTPGDVCRNGTIYLGALSPGAASGTGTDRYMTTPGGCRDIPAAQTVVVVLDSPIYNYPNGDFTPACAGTDQLKKAWNNGSGNGYDIPGLTNYESDYGDGFGATNLDSNYGSTNTASIAAITAPAQGGYHAAALYCANLVYGGYNDWYLPNRYELNLIFTNKSILPGLSFDDDYWSSTEQNNEGAWRQRFSYGSQGTNYKYVGQYVRCVRRF